MNHEVACAIGFGIAKLISYLFMQFIQKVQMLGRLENIYQKITGEADSKESEKNYVAQLT